MSGNPRVPDIVLNNGLAMPMVGLGTFHGNYDYKSNYDLVFETLGKALTAGYRHIDTAMIYDTEKAIGDAVKIAVKNGVVQREELFITSKLWCNFHKREDVEKGLRKSLSDLGLEYIELFLIHWPIAFKAGDDRFPKDEKDNIIYADDEIDYLETWKGMEDVYKKGLVKAIGLSNFNTQQVQRILENCEVKPAAIQIESWPMFSNADLVGKCHSNDIAVVAFSPLGKPSRPWKQDSDPSIFTDPTIAEIAAKHRRTVAQVALRYQIQRGIAVVPKTVNRDRLKENIEIFDFILNPDEMEQLKNLDVGFRVLWIDYLRASSQYPFKQ